MSSASTVIPEIAGWMGRSRARHAEAFVERSRDRLEDRLASECEALVRPLGALTGVLAEAVGTEGRGGARWRPLFTLAVADANAGALDVAVAVELTHTASLVLDDLPCMDDAELRRGRPATHRLVGSAGAILLSVGLLARAAELLGRQPGCGGSLAAEWGDAIGFAGMAGGQAMDIAGGRRIRGAKRRLHRAKSAALPAFALSAGARLCGASEATRMALAAFGRGVGWAYQLLDDVADQAEDEKHGRVSVERPISRSERIMRGAYRRLDDARSLDANARAVLAGLAERVVPAPASSWDALGRSHAGRP